MAKPVVKTTTTSSSGTTTGLGVAGGGNIDINKFIQDRLASGNQNIQGSAYTYTPQEADAAIQDMYTQLLGRNASGAEYQRAYKVYMSQDQQTGYRGRAQAIQNIIQGTPEYAARSQDKWLDTIYQDLAQKIARTKQ
jgi:hypothetical protein